MSALEGFPGPAFAVRLGFPLKSKSNFRRSRSKSVWAPYADFEIDTARVVASERPSTWVLPEATVPFKERPLVIAAIVAVSALDAANFSKSLLDALEGVLFVSDASVVGVSSVGVRSRVEQDALLGFAQLPAGASVSDIAQLLSKLTESVAPLL